MSRYPLMIILTQRRRNDNINKTCVLEGVGEGKIYGKLSKNAVFPEKFHDKKELEKFADFMVRNSLSFGRLLLTLSRRLAATESIAVQWVLMAPHPMGFPLVCPMGHDGWPHPFVGGTTHQLNPLKPHLQRISKITVCSRKPATQC